MDAGLNKMEPVNISCVILLLKVLLPLNQQVVRSDNLFLLDFPLMDNPCCGYKLTVVRP